MLAESLGNVHAISPKRAIGLMQIMPETWAELRLGYGPGVDPYDPRQHHRGRRPHAAVGLHAVAITKSVADRNAFSQTQCSRTTEEGTADRLARRAANWMPAMLHG